MIGLLASLVCVAQTDVCAPSGSTVAGTLGPSGGQVVITPKGPMTALGARFRADSQVTVSVQPWGSSDGHRGAIVHVSGELDGEGVVAGARVAGTVRVGQLQGRPGTPQLVQATDIKGGELTLPAGKIELAAGMRLDGNVDIAGTRLQVTSTNPIHALGLELDPGTITIEQRDGSYAIRGTLARPQEIAGVLVQREVSATVEHGHPRFESATFARDTSLLALGLPDGTAPAGTRVAMSPGQSFAFGPITVCGIALVPSTGGVYQPAVTFTPSPPKQVIVAGTLAAADVDVGEGVHLSGPVVLHYDTASCQHRQLEGTLASPTEQVHLHFAARTAIVLAELDGEKYARGTLARTESVDGLALTGVVAIGAHRLSGTLATPARFEAWNVPAGTQIERSPDQWSFTVPPRTSARAVAEHRGERFDEVTEVRSGAASTTLELRHAHVLKGTTLALSSLEIDHKTGCVFGGPRSSQHFGIFTIPADGSVTVCGTTVTAAQGTFAVPSLQVGRWFATSAIAGKPGAPPTATTPASPHSTAVTGYWLQINSLCQGAAGIPLPPPAERWIWVDLQGNPATEAERRELAAQAAKPGKACPVTACCPP